MKKCLRFGAFIGVLALSLAAGLSRPAWAYPLCDSLNGTACSPNGSTTPCTTVDNLDSSCKCRNGHWLCLL